jgi:membrane protein implicated in regulation of membrane protease activity
MPVEWLFTWWNAVYTLPLAFVLVFLTITSVLSLAGGAFGELAQGHTDVGHHVEVDHDVDLGHDVDLHHDMDVDHDVDMDHDMDMDHDADVDHDTAATTTERATGTAQGHSAGSAPGPLVSAMVAIGVGRAPLVMLIQILLLLWGLIGIGLHQAFHVTSPLALLWSFPATLVLSVLGTRGFAYTFGRYLRQKETYAVGRNEMVGRTGSVVFAVTEEEGTVHIRDRHGTLHRLRARTEQGRLESGQPIIVIGYDPDKSLYYVDDSSAFVDRA